MPDITMCEGTGCLLKDTCYRAQAKPSEYRQAYFYEPPFEEKMTEHSCDYHWLVRETKSE